MSLLQPFLQVMVYGRDWRWNLGLWLYGKGPFGRDGVCEGCVQHRPTPPIRDDLHIVIATPQAMHKEIAEAAFAAGKPVLCEKPMGEGLADAESMAAAAKALGVANLVGYNYIKTPASQYARQLVADSVIGDVTWFRGEHTEDFPADPEEPWAWRCQGMANGTMGDLAPHMINAALALLGPIDSLIAEVETVHTERPGGTVDNDDHAQIMCRFASGVMGHVFFSRVATGRKMGYAYEITGTKGAIRFDQEDQNAIHLYKMDGPEAERGVRKILTGPAHPDYVEFCQGPGHGTGYQDQIIIEAIHSGEAVWPTFQDGLDVARVVHTALRSAETRSWTPVLKG